MSGVIMHGADRGTHLFISEGEKPSDAAFQSLREIKPQGLNQHHGGELLYDQEASGLGLTQLLHHLLQRPAQRGPISFLSEMDDRRQNPQQYTGMISGKREVPSETKAITAAIQRVNASRGQEDRVGIDRRRRQIACNSEGPTAWQQEAVSCLQPDRSRNIID